MTKAKSQPNNFNDRFKEILADPTNKLIPRHEKSGLIENNTVISHNGLKLTTNYYGDFIKIMQLNKGVHEPQEEYIFGEVLKYIKPNSTMLELGSYWSFYSLWFNKEIKDATNFMVEPIKENLECGKQNFQLNDAKGIFINDYVGKNHFTIKRFMEKYNVKHIDILHSDIQGHEIDLLVESEKEFTSNKISYCFISTHSQAIHLKCVEIIKKYGYKIIAEADFDNQTFCSDGILIAKNPSIREPGYYKLTERHLTSY